MDHLLREKAPISDAGWAEIEMEATRTLRHYLAARKLVEYSCAGGWARGSTTLGRVTTAPSANPAVALKTRIVQPLTEIRVPFVLDRDELESLDRGAPDFDTGPIVEAARAGALAEDSAVFLGNPDLQIKGIAAVTTNAPLQIDSTFRTFPDQLAAALDALQNQGLEGPYGIAMGPDVWTSVMESAESGGYPLLKHVRLMVDGPVVWAAALSGAVLLSQRGGDYEISGGQDWSIGYLHHDADSITMYLEESFTSIVNTPEAAVRFDFTG